MILTTAIHVGNLTVTELHPVYYDNPKDKHLACLLPPVTGRPLILFKGANYVEEWTSAMAEARIQELIDAGALEQLINPQPA